MGIVQRLYKSIANAPILPSLENVSQKTERSSNRFDLFRRRMRLRGNSSISVPLALVLLFPCIVVILILILFVRHPSSPGRHLMPAGSPPAIR